eukprot:2823287-Pleurochrysis_carterae.AAC.1
MSSGRLDSGVSVESCVRSSTSPGTRFSAERVSRLSARSDSCLPTASGALPSAMLRDSFPVERVPRLSALLGSALSP